MSEARPSPEDELPEDSEPEDELPKGARITVSELRPFAPASGAYLDGTSLGDGRGLQLSFDPGDSDAVWSEGAINAWFDGLDKLPRGMALRLTGRLTRSGETGRARMRVLTVTDQGGRVLWHAIPAGHIALSGVYTPPQPPPLLAKDGSVMFEYAVPEPKRFRATAFTHDENLLDAMSAMPGDDELEVFTQPDNYLRREDWYQCPHCVRKSAFDDHEAGCPSSDEHRFLLGFLHSGRFTMTERRGSGTMRILRLFGQEPRKDEWFELRHRVARHAVQVTRFDPANPELYFSLIGWGAKVIPLRGIPDEFLAPLPKALKRGLGAALGAPDPIDIMPVSLIVSIADGPLSSWERAETAGAPNVWLWPQAVDETGQPFAHSLVIFQLAGGRAALPDAQAAVAQGRVWIEDWDRSDGRGPAFTGPVFDGNGLYEDDHQIGYAYE